VATGASGGVFTGTIFNSGKITSYATGIYVDDVGYSSFAGHIGNSGSIVSSHEYGIYVSSVAEASGAVRSSWI